MARPGPKPDPSKPNSRYNPASRHNRGGADRCSAGHLWEDGSYKVRSDGKKVCLKCTKERKGETCKNGHDRAIYQNKYGHCKECARLKGKTHKLASKYKLTLEEFETKLFNQDYKCAICRDDLDFDKHNGVCVDHDHSCCPGQTTCGECVREILCGDCNQMLGRAKDSPEILRAAIKYLERN